MCAPGTRVGDLGDRDHQPGHSPGRVRGRFVVGHEVTLDRPYPLRMGAGHDHGHDGRAGRRTAPGCGWCCWSPPSVAVVELVGAVLSGSLALLADAGHMFTDTAAIVLALSASYVATLPATPRRTFGYHRAEILAALINAVVLLGVCGYLAYAGVRRLLDPVERRGRADAGLRRRRAWSPTWSRSRCSPPAATSR